MINKYFIIFRYAQFVFHRNPIDSLNLEFIYKLIMQCIVLI